MCLDIYMLASDHVLERSILYLGSHIYIFEYIGRGADFRA